MKNAHLRVGWLTYVKRREKAAANIRLRLDRFIGEVLLDPQRQAKAHFLSVIGGDTQISSVSRRSFVRTIITLTAKKYPPLPKFVPQTNENFQQRSAVIKL